jgi:ribonuclease P protein subunit RPR2
VPPVRDPRSRGRAILSQVRRDDPGVERLDPGATCADPVAGIRRTAPRSAAGVDSSSAASASTRVRPTAAGGPPASREILPGLQQCDIGERRRLSRMRGPGGAARRGRRGRRTATMIRAARERIQDLFTLAERGVAEAPPELARRYVELARKIGMRYNVRLPREYRELYCRGCSAFWVEGRTVRTRFRQGRRVQTCLACGRVRRVPLRRPRVSARFPDSPIRRPAALDAVVPAEDRFVAEEEDGMEEGQ